MKKHHVARAVAMLLIAILPAMSAPTYAQAVADYKAGKYGQAALEFESLKQTDPNNGVVRYYLALCRQRLNQFGPAKYEFEWISQFGDEKLKGLAAQGIASMSGAKSSSAGAGQSQSAHRKVKEILDFYADW